MRDEEPTGSVFAQVPAVAVWTAVKIIGADVVHCRASRRQNQLLFIRLVPRNRRLRDIGAPVLGVSVGLYTFWRERMGAEPETIPRFGRKIVSHTSMAAPFLDSAASRTCSYHPRRNATRSHIRRTRQSMLSQRLASSMRLPLQTSRPLWLQYRQIACCTNRGKILGYDGLNCRASIPKPRSTRSC